MDRKSDPRTFKPSLSGGTQTVSGTSGQTASKDSLIGKNSVTEYKPGKCPMGGGSLGGKPK